MSWWYWHVCSKEGHSLGVTDTMTLSLLATFKLWSDSLLQGCSLAGTLKCLVIVLYCIMCVLGGVPTGVWSRIWPSTASPGWPFSLETGTAAASSQLQTGRTMITSFIAGLCVMSETYWFFFSSSSKTDFLVAECMPLGVEWVPGVHL